VQTARQLLVNSKDSKPKAKARRLSEGTIEQTEKWFLSGMNPRLLCFGLGLVTLLAYLSVRNDGFLHYDDPTYITDNRVVQGGISWRGLIWAFTTITASNWHPVTWLSHMLDCQLFGAEAGAHHLVSVLWHAANGALALLLYYELTKALWPSAFAAALLVWHPLRVESVAWAAERKDVLSVFFFLLTLLTYCRYTQRAAESAKFFTSQGSNDSASPLMNNQARLASAAGIYLLTLGLFALGLMSKPMLVTTPFVLLLLDYWPLGRINLSPPASERWRGIWKLILEKVPFFLLALGSSVATYMAQRQEAVVALTAYPFRLRLANTVLAYGGYLWKTIWPINLSVIYPFPRYLPWAQIILSTITLVALCLICWGARRTRPYLLVGWLWFLGTLVPVIGLVQVGSAALADRYTYIPHIGLFLALALEAHYWTSRWHWKPWLGGLTASAVLIACLALTIHQIGYWKDGVSLFTHAINITSENPMAQLNLAVSLEVKGARREALTTYQEALRLNPELQQANNALGDLYNELGKTNEAIAHYRAELKLREQPLTHENLGAILLKLGRTDEAMENYEAAARLDPADPRAHYLMAKALLRSGRSAEAVVQFREALGRDADNVQSLVYLARVLAADRDARVRNGAEAIGLAERANLLTGDSQSFVLDTLAMAYAEVGRFAEAQQTLQHALDLAKGTDDPGSIAAMQERLKIYQAGKPYRQDFSAPSAETSSP
jgi:tetratricopeptide (TPR) repeat protein